MNCPTEALNEDLKIEERVFSGAISGQSNCVGSLTITHRDDQLNFRHLNLGGYRNSYLNIQRGFPSMKRNIVIHFEVIGNCCWELYAKRRFKGGKQVVYPGGNPIFPDFKPVSLKRLECTN